MSMTTDPIADMLTRIRNALTAKHETVEIPASKIKVSIAEILKNQGFITSYRLEENEGKKTLVIVLKYSYSGERVITGLKRISKPGLRIYSEADKIPSVLKGLGIAIVSTPNGLLTDHQARKQHVGGEILCYVW